MLENRATWSDRRHHRPISTGTENRVQLLENLSTQLIDTKTLLDHDNYNNALSFYRMLRFLAGENEPGAKPVYEDMRVLFNRTGTSNNTDTEA